MVANTGNRPESPIRRENGAGHCGRHAWMALLNTALCIAVRGIAIRTSSLRSASGTSEGLRIIRGALENGEQVVACGGSSVISGTHSLDGSYIDVFRETGLVFRQRGIVMVRCLLDVNDVLGMDMQTTSATALITSVNLHLTWTSRLCKVSKRSRYVSCSDHRNICTDI